MTAATALAPGEVHVIQFSLDKEAVEQSRLQSFLATDELTRADRLRDGQTRNRFVAGRGMLREILGGYLGLAPGSLNLTVVEHGKPKLAAEQGESGFCFNLSHSGDLAMLAVSRGCELGIDLELQQDDLPFQGMAAQFFSSSEQTDLFSLPPEMQLAAFYRCWTRKEAYLKGCGRGFSEPASNCDITLLPGQPPALLQHRTRPDEPARWSLMDLTAPEGNYAALAVRGDAPLIRYLY